MWVDHLKYEVVIFYDHADLMEQEKPGLIDDKGICD